MQLDLTECGASDDRVPQSFWELVRRGRRQQSGVQPPEDPPPVQGA